MAETNLLHAAAQAGVSEPQVRCTRHSTHCARPDMAAGCCVTMSIILVLWLARSAHNRRSKEDGPRSHDSCVAGASVAHFRHRAAARGRGARGEGCMRSLSGLLPLQRSRHRGRRSLGSSIMMSSVVIVLRRATPGTDLHGLLIPGADTYRHPPRSSRLSADSVLCAVLSY